MPVYVGRLIIHTFVHFPMISRNFFTIYNVEIESKCDIFLMSSTSVTVYYRVNTMSVKYSQSTEDGLKMNTENLSNNNKYLNKAMLQIPKTTQVKT
jgi:hypothetical protein